ncbi:MAG: hypothetical protein KDD45_06205 [Bdellovibrionales bacterium]|nr:hypothetical protein [Bdellovibrionales bacterium]
MQSLRLKYIFLYLLFPILSSIAAETASTANPPIVAPVEDKSIAVITPTSASTETSVSENPQAAGINQKITESTGPSKLEQIPCSGLSHSLSNNLKATCEDLKSLSGKCDAVYDKAALICRTETNKDLLSTMTQIQALMGVAQGLTDSCSAFGKVMNLAKTGMAAYTLGCGGAKKTCDIYCGKTTETLKKYSTVSQATQKNLTLCVNQNNALYESSLSTGTPNINAKNEAEKCSQDLMYIQGNLDPMIKEENSPSEKVTVVAKTEVCKIDMSSLLGMGMINIGSIAQSKLSSDQCKKETSSNTPTTTAATDTVVDCGVATNADKPICICKANPRLSGCEGVSTSMATNSNLAAGSGGDASGASNGGLNNPVDTAGSGGQFPEDLSKNNANDGKNLAGSGFGSGSTAGLSTNSSSGSSDGKGDGSSKNSDLSANILSGDEGGGGGRGSRGFNFGNSNLSPAQLRKIAAMNGITPKLNSNAWSSQVTSNAGKSNFDKIKARYNENRSSLLNK